MSDNVLSMRQFKDKKLDAILDQVETPQEQLDQAHLEEAIRRHPANGKKRAKLRVVK